MSELACHIRELSISRWGRSKAVEMVGLDSRFLDLQSKLQKVAAFEEPVLITGESGSGKEALAKALYLLGARNGKPYVSVSCPQYQEGNLTVSELFGHKRGSFTGAVADRKGCFETADGGVIFLDEVADLHISAQLMLLRALASGEFQPLGADSSKSVNVRVVAATNRPLRKLSLGDLFRRDLYFRLRYFLLEVPPLRERGDDWRLLLDYHLAKLHKRYGIAKRFSQSSLRLLEDYDWPGNVRQLMSVATMGYALCDGDTIEPDDFAAQLEAPARPGDGASEDLYFHVVAGPADFWKLVYEPFLDRELNRGQVRAVIKRGLLEAQGSYRRLLTMFRIQSRQYQKFMDFLRHHRLKP